MMKFFRKHTKKLLAVFMALLLIVWLGGDAFTYMLGGGKTNRVLAESIYGPIEQTEHDFAGSQTTLLTNLGIPWNRPFPGISSQIEPLSPADWILLNREAERYGIRPRSAEAEQFLTNLGRAPEDVHRVAQRYDISVDVVFEAVRKYLAVRETVNLVIASAARSEAQFRLAAKNELETVKINAVRLDASTFVDPELTFSDDEIKAQFEKHRDQPNRGGLEFGYVQPPLVKVQYIKIGIDEIAKNTRVRERTLESKAMEYWNQHRESQEFLRPPDLTEKKDEVEMGPADPNAPAEKPKSPYFETFEEAREVATQKVRRQMAEGKITEIAGWLANELNEPWFDAPVGDDGYRAGPPEIMAENYYAGVLQRLPENLRYGNAVSIEATDFVKKSDIIMKAPGIGSGKLAGPGNAGTKRFEDAVFLVQGVEPMPTGQGAATSEFLAVGQTHPLPVTDANGNMYLFRVMGVRPSGPPQSVDEVRKQVIDDLRLLRGYDEAKRLAEKIKAGVTLDGLKAAFDADDECKTILSEPSGYHTPPPTSRRYKGTSGMGYRIRSVSMGELGQVDDEFIESCFSLGEAKKTPPVEIMSIGKTGTIAVVEWVASEPLRQDQYEADRKRLASQLSRAVITSVAGEWLNPERIRDRSGWVLAKQ